MSRRLRLATVIGAVFLSGCAAVETFPVEPVAIAPAPEVTEADFAEAPDLQTEINAHMSTETAPEETHAAPPETRAEVRANELVAYLAAVVRANPVAQKKELAQSAAAFGRAPTPYARLRLGGLYAQPTPTLRDDVRALALLEPLATAPPVPERPVFDLAWLLYAQVAERQRLAKDDAKKQDELRERIEAMKSIERSILQREERQRTR